VNDATALLSSGFNLPTPLWLAGAIVFSFAGLAAWRYGKKADKPMTKWIGLALMLYSYATAETWLLYAVGVGLCVGLYVFRD
jgi:hypothetical protein